MVIDTVAIEEWRIKGMLHRLDGPARTWPDGQQEWHFNGQYHRLDGPAVSHPDGFESWWVNGQIHRVDGPAVIGVDGDEEWWTNGMNVTEEVEFWIEEISINPKWRDWGNFEKFLFKLRF